MWLIEKKSYLSMFPFIYFHFYLKSIVFVCRMNAQVDDSLALHGYSAMLWFYKGGKEGEGEGVDENGKPYLSKSSSISLCFYLKIIVFICRRNAWMDNSLAFDIYGMFLSFYR